MRIFAIIAICIVLYLFITFGFYYILNKADPYDEAADYFGDGDSNVGIALFWPFTIPFLIISIIVVAIIELMKAVCR